MIKMYKCDRCFYSSTRYADFQRHKKRKIPCINKIEEVVDNSKDGQKVMVAGQKVMVAGQKVMVAGQKVMVAGQKVMVAGQKVMVDFECKKCRKILQSKKRLIEHENKCDGLDKKQCKICLKVFATKQSKYEHVKHVKCEPPSSTQIINNNIINNTNNNIFITNNTNKIINNNINIVKVDFGKESLTRLCSEVNYVATILENFKLGKYSIPKTIELIYFNDSYPENQTIKKDRRNDKMVSVLYNGRWETRLFDDVKGIMIKKTEEYHKQYFKNLQKTYETVAKNKEFRKMVIPYRRFAKLMIWLGWHCEEIRKIGTPLSDEEMDDDDYKKMFSYQKDMDDLMLDKICDQTCRINCL
jgi:hypothetical protein